MIAVRIELAGIVRRLFDHELPSDVYAAAHAGAKVAAAAGVLPVDASEQIVAGGLKTWADLQRFASCLEGGE